MRRLNCEYDSERESIIHVEIVDVYMEYVSLTWEMPQSNCGHAAKKRGAFVPHFNLARENLPKEFLIFALTFTMF